MASPNSTLPAAPPAAGRQAPTIALHVLMVESARASADRYEALVRTRFPGSVITRLSDARRAERMVRRSVFDLVVVLADPLRKGHAALVDRLRRHPTPMPALIAVAREQVAALQALAPDLPPGMELATLEALTDAVFEHHIRRAIENHQRHWELQHLQQAFRSSLVQYRNLFDEVPDLIFLCDRSGCLLDINQTGVRWFGLPKEKMLLRPITETFGLAPEDFRRLIEPALQQEGPIRDVEIEFRPPGRPPVFGLAHLIRWSSGPSRPLQFQGVIKDISPHKRLERELRRSEDRYKSLYELARICAASLQLDEMAQRAMEQISRCCGCRGAVLLINRYYEALHLAGACPDDGQLRADFAAGPPPALARDLIGRWAIAPGIHRLDPAERADLHPAIERWLERLGSDTQLIGLPLGRGNPTMTASLLLLGLAPDRAEALDAELLAGLGKTLEMGMTNCLHFAAAKDAEQRYRLLWEHAPAMFLSLLKGGAIFEINRTALRALGCDARQAIGRSLIELIDPADRAEFQRCHERLLATGEPQAYELRLVRADGSRLTVSVHSEPLRDPEGAVQGEKMVMHDITRNKELEDQLRHYAQNLEQMVAARTLELTQTMNLLNGILDGSTEYAIFALDRAGVFLHFNRGAQLLFGYDAAAMVGVRTLAELIDFDRAPWPSLDALLAAVDRAGVVVAEAPMQTADARGLTALLTINRLKEPSADNLLYVGIARDITEQKEMEELLKLYTENLQHVIEQKSRELERQHMQLIQSSKLATLGEMAAGIAHELNQPLSGIRTRAQLVSMALARDRVDAVRIARSQEEIIQLVDRISRIIQHMRIFARQDQQRFAPFKLTQSIDGALSLMGEQLRIHAIELQRDLPDELPLIYGESLQIEQVLINLFSNARDALDAREEELRATGAHAAYRKVLRVEARLHTPQEICVTIADNGIGIPEESLPKIFEPFYTTKPVGRGTGLGLSISYGIIASHNGRIEVESRPGEGAVFRIFLPVWDGPVPDAADGRPAGGLP